MMIGYDTHGPQCPPNDDVLPLHYDLDPDATVDPRDEENRADPCFCELVETKDGWWCEDCQQYVVQPK